MPAHATVVIDSDDEVQDVEGQADQAAGLVPAPAPEPPPPGTPGSQGQAGCIICMDSIGKEGPHHAVATKCGHVYGRSCIVKWLAMQARGAKKKCPQCQQPIKEKEIITLYNLPTVVSGDAAHTRELEAQVAQAQRDKEKVEKENAALAKDKQAAMQRADQLERELAQEKMRQQTREAALRREERQRHKQSQHQAAAQQAIVMQQAAAGRQGPGCLQPSHNEADRVMYSCSASQGVGHPAGTQQLGGGHMACTQAGPGPGLSTHLPGFSRHPGQGTQQLSGLEGHKPFAHAAVAPHIGICPRDDTFGPQIADFGGPAAVGHSGHAASMLQADLAGPAAMGSSSMAPPPARPPQQQHQGLPPLRSRFIARHELQGGRCLDIQPDEMLLLASHCDGSRHALRKSSLHCPQASRLVGLPAEVTRVSDIKIHPSRGYKLAALATQGSGLLLMSTANDQPAATLTAAGTSVWSCAWNDANEYQIMAGLDRGRVALYDIRAPSECIVTFELPSPRPVHTVFPVTLPLMGPPVTAAGTQAAQAAEASLNCLVAATSQGVWQVTQLSGIISAPLAAQPAPGLSCESVTCAIGGSGGRPPRMVVSWRAPPGMARGPTAGPRQPLAGEGLFSMQGGGGGEGDGGQHCSYTLLPGSGGAQAMSGTQAQGTGEASVQGSTQLHAQEELMLGGHRSTMYMTRAALLPGGSMGPAGGPAGLEGGVKLQADWPYLAHADGASCQPWVWDLTSGALVAALQPHPNPVLQLVGCEAPSMGVLLGVCSSTLVEVYQV